MKATENKGYTINYTEKDGIFYEDEKLSAVKRYMKKKDTDLDEEMSAYLEKLYQKYVPAGVQEYIAEREVDDTPAPVRRSKSTGGDSE